MSHSVLRNIILMKGMFLIEESIACGIDDSCMHRRFYRYALLFIKKLV